MNTLPALLALSVLVACGRAADLPPSDAAKPALAPAFDGLYGANCSGCHGDKGRNGAALSLDDPVYRAIVDSAALRRVVAAGVPGTLMPAFARSAGGTLTDSEIEALVQGIRMRWRRPTDPWIAGAPAYASPEGNSAAGATVYATFCAACHGASGSARPRSGAVSDPSYLALVSNQWLRTVIIVGRPERGMPDWRSVVSGRPLTNREITDVVAWLAAQRVLFAGQPYAPHQ
jgi:cytochrome c oxidase cbb3-type subunit 3